MALRSAAIDVFSDVAPAMRSLSRRDSGLKAAGKAIGKPHIRRRDGGFQGLFRIIVEQQVSVPSAQAIWKRCHESVDCASPAAINALGIEGLRKLGLSTPKARYVADIALAFSGGGFNLTTLAELDDDKAMAQLVALRGVGPWTASIYLLFCEGRVDIWPPNDVALKHAYNAAAGANLDQKALDAKADAWSPWRGVAAHILWTYFAQLRGRTPI
jgi:DNA-3-methyladenine glycosylase II